MQRQALRIEKGDEPDDVRKWTVEMEEQVSLFKEITNNVREAVKNLHEDALREERDEEEKKEEELKLAKGKMDIKWDYEKLEEDLSKSLENLRRRAARSYPN